MAGPIQLLTTNQQTVAALRLDSRDQADTNIAGYVGVDGNTVAIPGDDDAPYAKSPPFTTQFAELTGVYTEVGNEIPTAHDAASSRIPILPVMPFRTVSVAVEYTPDAAAEINGFTLIAYAVVPQQQTNLSDALFYPIGFASPTATGVIPPGFDQTFANRTLQPQVFTFASAADSVGPIRLVYSFDVSAYTLITFTVAESIGGGDDSGTLRLFVNANM